MIPDDYTMKTRCWLNKRFDLFDEAGVYVPNQPSYGFSALAFRLHEYARNFAILRLLDRIPFDTLLDVGAADGYLAALIRYIFKAGVTAADLSDRALVRAHDLYGLHGCCLDAHDQPFREKSFDVVIASEVIEHLADPEKALWEMRRLAKRFVIITTPRARDESESRTYLDSRDPGEPHAHIHYFTDSQMSDLCGESSYYGKARSRIAGKFLEMAAWGDESSELQRRSYYEFTIHSSELSEGTARNTEYQLMRRYEKNSPLKQHLFGWRSVGSLLKFDSVMTDYFPGSAQDHLVLVPLDRFRLARRGGLGASCLLKVMLNDFKTPPLKRPLRENPVAQS